MNALVAAAEGIRRLAVGMLAEGGAAEQLTQLISNLNDHLTVRIIELTRIEFELPKVEWCWLAFGSEGRYEQTLSTDQDNGLVFVAPEEEAAALREAFLPFARVVNERLAQCGFPLCKGNVMASNPELCLSVYEWHATFGGWMRANSPQALLDATIYFDFRPIYGQEELADQLREWVLKRVPSETLFLRFMAGNAVQIEPPIGFIRDFTFDKNPEFPHTLDLKASGARLFVDAARILALANGVTETGTVQRLRALAERGKLGGDDVHAVIESFFYIQKLRLRNQQSDVSEGAANRVDPDTLNELDRLVLREAFKQAKRLQSRLQLEYRL
jgi:CBS domain-containing protein